MQPKTSSSRLAEEPGKSERKGGKITSASPNETVFDFYLFLSLNTSEGSFLY